MGIADMDFRCAPAISKALADRIRHENWGYLDLPRSYTDGIINWNKRRQGIDINPDLLLVTDGVHPDIISVLKPFRLPEARSSFRRLPTTAFMETSLSPDARRMRVR